MAKHQPPQPVAQTQPVLAQSPEQTQAPTPAQVATPADTAGTTAPADAPINFDEPIAAKDLVAGTGEKPEDAMPLLTPEQMAKLHAAAENDNTKRDFTLKVLAARTPKDEAPPAPAPLAPRMAEQTNAEIAAGRAMNAHHEALQAKRPAPVPEQHSQAVFRPADYVPNQKKAQGYVQGRNV